MPPGSAPGPLDLQRALKEALNHSLRRMHPWLTARMIQRFLRRSARTPALVYGTSAMPKRTCEPVFSS